ncbi:Protein MMF1, mitochondrial [Vanrija pseudolonga]|uniref:Protein MMF1, mitochondrial n=1 Tax=Vanrija pseudolonga TaxID=143232 RepID=A0AAF0Y5K5_9TREE|nr:Protein MMF1, mitochondrial [Vanrija pseudolonga]
MADDRKTYLVPGYPAPPSFLSTAIVSGGFIYCSGALPVTPDGKMVEGTFGDRVTAVLDNLEAVLKAHGSGLEHTVKALIFITDYANFDELNRVYTPRMPTPAPARSCIGAAKLPRGSDIEIELVALAPRAKL